MKPFADIEPEISAVGLCVDLPVVVLRSFGKFYGLAGLRLGLQSRSKTSHNVSLWRSVHGLAPDQP